MYKITCDITLDVNNSVAQNTITMQQGIADGIGTFKGRLEGKANRTSVADCLAEGSEIGLSGVVTGTPTLFDGWDEIIIPVTAVDPTKLSADAPITKGGTGATTADETRQKYQICKIYGIQN